MDVGAHGGGDIEKSEEGKVCDVHFNNKNRFHFYLLVLQYFECVLRRKFVVEDELPDEVFSELDIEAIEKSIIVVPDSESDKVL